MWICENHFLSPFVVVKVNGEELNRVMGVDTELMVAMRLVGYEPENMRPIVDLIKVDGVEFRLDEMPEGIKDLLPNEYK